MIKRILSLSQKKYKSLFLIWFGLMNLALFLPKSFPIQKPTISIPHFDKFIHYCIFLIMAILGHIWKIKKSHNPKNVYYFGILFAIISEIIQHYFITGRNGSFFDFLADIAGLITAYFIVKQLQIKLHSNFF